MQQGIVEAVESLLKDQVALASQINELALSQYPALVKVGDLLPEDAENLLALTSKLSVLESERNGMLEASGVTLDVLMPLSASLRQHVEELRVAILVMRENISKNIAILDVQVLRTRSMFEAARQARGGSGDPVEYGPNGHAKRGSGGSLLGAG
jgi:flagellar biosynthesis/type III secretory pathway chaperone